MTQLDKLNLLALYPQYMGKKVDIHRYTIFPIDVKSMHKGEQVTFTRKAAESVVNQVPGTPVLFSQKKGKSLPSDHGTKDNNRDVIGTVIGGGIVKDGATDWVYADCIVYSDIKPDIHQTIMDNIDDVGTSIEADVAVDNNNSIMDVTLTGLSIMNKNNTAWKTMALVADKGESNTVTVTYDEAIQNIIKESYEKRVENEINKRTEDLRKKEDEVNRILNEKEEIIQQQKNEIESLLKINEDLANII